MKPDHLIELATQVRSFTLEFLELPADWLLWTPPGTSNHMLWHAGHAVWVVDLLCIEPLCGASELPAGWAERFGGGSRPADVQQWPAPEQVAGQLKAQLARLVGLLKSANLDVFDDWTTILAHGWTLPAGFLHGLHDEARHHGEMHLLFKLARQHFSHS